MSHTPVVATTPILSASPGPATTNTYMRFNPMESSEMIAAPKPSYRESTMSLTFSPSLDESPSLICTKINAFSEP